MSEGPSNERLSELIGLIYDCVLDPGRWQPTLDALRLELGFANASLSIMAMLRDEVLVMATSGIELPWLEQLPNYGAEAVTLWGGASRLTEYPLAEPVVLSQAIDPRSYQNNRMYREWVEPQGLVDQVGIALQRDAAGFGNVGFGLRRQVVESDLAPLRLLAPHLRRAVVISHLMDLRLVAATTFARALDALRSAVLLVDEQLAIVHANSAAEALLAAGDAVDSHAGRLHIVAQPRPLSALADAVARIARSSNHNDDGSALGQRGIGIPIERRDGAPPLVAHVLPLQAGELRPGVSQRAVAAVFFADAAAPVPAHSQALALLYDLTPAETRVFELIAAGRTQVEVAAQLGIAPSTVKTHLLRVFDKTGCARQAELVRLAASLSV